MHIDPSIKGWRSNDELQAFRMIISQISFIIQDDADLATQIVLLHKAGIFDDAEVFHQIFRDLFHESELWK